MRAVVNLSDESLRESVEGLLTLSGVTDGGDGVLVVLDGGSAETYSPEDPDGSLLVFCRADSYLRSPTHRRLADALGERYAAVRLPCSLAGVLALLTRLGSRTLPAPPNPDESSREQNAPKPFPVISSADRTIAYRGQVAALTSREFGLFSALYAAHGMPVSRDALLAAVWGREQTDTNLTDVYIRYLRRKLNPLFGDGVILSVRGKGYVLRMPEG